ncbi:MAG TPA: hypothetical protein VL523_07145 [Terriglobia bacterium]|nr:hypothetical protein [Terriglobia bacterium]
MRKRSIVKWILAASILGCCAVTSLAGESNDKLTGLPLHPGMNFAEELNSPICGKKTKNNLYMVPFNFKSNSSPAMADYLTWYKAQLKGFHYFHRIWDNRPQEMFYAADGTKGVTLTGVPKGNTVFTVSYLSFSPGLTTHEMEAFSPTNLSCK